jgi:capsular exopolysaccharide synthesis family protein
MDIVAAQPNDATLAELYLRVRSVLKRRWKVFAVVAAATFIVLAVGVMLIKPTYTAQTKVRIDPTRDPVANKDNTARTTLSDEAIDTEVSAFYSMALAKQVVDELNLTRAPELVKAAMKAAPANNDEDLRSAIASSLLGGLSVYREQQTYVLDVDFSDRDPVKAAMISNAFATNYIKGAVGTRTSVATEQAKWYQEQLGKLSGEIAVADNAAATFKAQHGLTVGASDTGFTGTLVDQQVPPLAASLAQAESDAAAGRAEYQAALSQSRRSGSGAVTGVLASPVVAQLRGQLAGVTQERDQKQAIYGPRHPMAKQYANNAEELEKQISAESRRIISSLGSAAAASEARAQSLRSALDQVENIRAEQARASVMANTLDRDADTKRELFKQLTQEAQASLQSSQNSMSSASVVNPAIPPQKPSAPNRPLLLTFAFIVGMAAGAATIAIQEMFSGLIRSSEDVEDKLGLRMLAAVPFERADRPGMQVRENPTSFYSESFRIARTALFGAAGWPANSPVIAFTSSLPGEGKTTCSLAFAQSIASSGQRTILIDCDVRRASLTGATGIPASAAGLVEFLSGEAQVGDIVMQTDVENFDMVMVRAPYFNATNLFDSDRMAKLVAYARAHYDQIVIDLPPIVGLADGRFLAGLADEVIFVIKWNSTPLAAAKAAVEALRAIGKEPSGVLVNAVDQNADMLAAGYYLDRYSNYYNQSSSQKA